MAWGGSYTSPEHSQMLELDVKVLRQLRWNVTHLQATCHPAILPLSQPALTYSAILLQQTADSQI